MVAIRLISLDSGLHSRLYDFVIGNQSPNGEHGDADRRGRETRSLTVTRSDSTFWLVGIVVALLIVWYLWLSKGEKPTMSLRKLGWEQTSSSSRRFKHSLEPPVVY